MLNRSITPLQESAFAYQNPPPLRLCVVVRLRELQAFTAQISTQTDEYAQILLVAVRGVNFEPEESEQLKSPSNRNPRQLEIR